MFFMLRSLKIKTCCLVFILSLPGVLLADTTLYKYVINLESVEKKSPIPINLKDFKISDKYKIYRSEVNLGRNKSFYRLRVGFFTSKNEADQLVSKFKSKYPKLWIDRINKQDREILVVWLKSNKNVVVKHEIEKSIDNSLKSNNSAEALMERAKKAMTEEKYRVAVGLYTRVIALKSSSHHKEAMEFLGVAREKNGQLTHARADYRLFLKKYPEGDDAERVRQRLLSLRTILLRPRKKLKKGKTRQSDMQFFGSILQFYRQDVISSDQSKTKIDTLSTNVNLLLRKRTESLNIKSQFNTSDLKYLNDSLRSDRDRINVFFVDVADINNNKSIRIGRQSQSKGGVLGRMDGALIGYRLNPTWKLNMVAGYPVQTSVSNLAQKNRPFMGVSADIETKKKNLDFNIYTINQKVDSIIDRNAVGGEIRYRNDNHSHFVFVDYDTYFSDLNTFFYVANLRFDNKAAVILTLNHNNSPILTTTNATQGQVTPSIESLLLTYSEDELYQFAKDRTAKYNSIALSTTIPITNKWSFNADGMMSNLSSTPSSAGIDAIDGTGNEFFYSAQFIGYNVFNVDETMRYQIRYDDTKSFKRVRLTASTRFKLDNKKWRLHPQITVEKRNSVNGATTNKINAGLKLDYKIKRKVKVELDVKYETGKTDFPVSITENNYFISAGFIWDF